ncbi:MAG: NADH-quinone oxidoreductase subunit N [Limisphaerales bacterium]
MNDFVVTGLELAVLVTGLAVLLLDLWARPEQRRLLGYGAVIAVGVIFLASFAVMPDGPRQAFGGMYVLDEFALFFKRFFLLAALFVLVMAIEFSDRFDAGVSEYFALTLFALLGMMVAASANDLTLLFVSLELITVTFYVLVGFQRRRQASLEAAVKYLLLGALSSAFLVYGIALVYGSSGTMSFSKLAGVPASILNSKLLWVGLLLVFVGLGFKVAAVPFQMWAPDVYQGAPAPTTAFLAVGSKAAGVVLLLRLLHGACPGLADRWQPLLMGVAALSILYGVLGAIPQVNLKRLLGYSSIANAGYLLLGVATRSREGVTAVLFYLGGYLFTVLTAFMVITVAMRQGGSEETGSLAGLHRRSPLLALAMTLSMVSLAGVPPLAGFFGKLLLLKAAVAQTEGVPGFWWLLGVAVFGVVVSLWYYFGVIRAMYWAPEFGELAPISVSGPVRWALYGAMAAMLWIGIMPNHIINLADLAAGSLKP